jgi:anti-sigma regulatory factor (Ser/Thr protein kinase)
MHTHLAEQPDTMGHSNPQLYRVAPRELAFTRTDLSDLRRFISREANDASLEGTRRDDLVLAVNELATNSVCYGGGRGVVRIWREADTLLCEVLDSGHIDELSLGRACPTPDQLAGRGLWLVNRLCDLVQIRSSPAGSVVRVHMRLA